MISKHLDLATNTSHFDFHQHDYRQQKNSKSLKFCSFIRFGEIFLELERLLRTTKKEYE
jgi:hypothetical protein